MDLKLLLRYQISGSVFIGWFLIFHNSLDSNTLLELSHKFWKSTKEMNYLSALPIGAFIHQFSVTIKNHILCKIFSKFKCLSDSPCESPTKTIIEKLQAQNHSSDKEKLINYINDKISNLNSFYYLRFDCGFLAPLLAWICFISINFSKVEFKCCWNTINTCLASAVILGFIMTYYIFRINKEVKEYNDKL